jgi:hypothetical protein
LRIRGLEKSTYRGALRSVLLIKYCTTNQIKRKVRGRKCGIYGKQDRFVRVLLGRPKSKRMFERSTRRWEDNIGMVLQELGWGGMDWIDLAQDKDKRGVVVNAVINLNFL